MLDGDFPHPVLNTRALFVSGDQLILVAQKMGTDPRLLSVDVQIYPLSDLEPLPSGAAFQPVSGGSIGGRESSLYRY